jgi:hypothetical protein
MSEAGCLGDLNQVARQILNSPTKPDVVFATSVPKSFLDENVRPGKTAIVVYGDIHIIKLKWKN